MTKVPLTKPLIIGDGDAKKTLTEISMDLDALTGADVQFCMREAAAAKGEMVMVAVFDVDLHTQIASKASGIAVADFGRMGARDYIEVVTKVQGFLMGSG